MAETISVIMPNYNDADYLRGALEAVCEQSYQPKEVIIVDDCSTDHSVQVVHELMSKYPMIRLIQNEVNRGTNYTINRGAAQATGDLLYLSSSNDQALPGLYEKSVRLLEKYPQAALSCADMYFVNIADNSSYRNPPGWLSEPGYLSPAQFAAATRVSNIPHPHIYTALVRRAKLPGDWIYRPELEWYADWFLVQVMALQHGCCYIPEPLALFRWLGRGNVYSGLRNRKQYKKVISRIVQDLAQPEYEEVTRLMIEGDCLKFVQPYACSPMVVGKALSEVKNPNQQTNNLFWYFTKRYIKEIFSPQTLSKLWREQLVSPIDKALHNTKGILKNRLDRVYSHVFHNYDRGRSLIKNGLKVRNKG